MIENCWILTYYIEKNDNAKNYFMLLFFSRYKMLLLLLRSIKIFVTTLLWGGHETQYKPRMLLNRFSSKHTVVSTHFRAKFLICRKPSNVRCDWNYKQRNCWLKKRSFYNIKIQNCVNPKEASTCVETRSGHRSRLKKLLLLKMKPEGS